MYFLFSKAGKLETSKVRVPYNKLLTNLASSSRTGEYWPSVVFVRTERSEVRTATTLGQYSPVRPSRSVSKRLLFIYCYELFTSSIHTSLSLLYVRSPTRRVSVVYATRNLSFPMMLTLSICDAQKNYVSNNYSWRHGTSLVCSVF